MDWSRFDTVSVACYTPYADRMERLRGEFARVGLAGVREFWQFPNPYDSLLQSGLRLTKTTVQPGHFSCSMGHYRIAKTLLTQGARNALIMEDDIVFLKDTDLLEKVVGALPSDADVALFEWRTSKKRAEENRTSIAKAPQGELWHRADDMTLVGCGMYYLSRKGLEWYVSRMEEGARNGTFRASDAWFRPGGYCGDVVPYCAVVRAAVQDSDKRCNSRGDPAFVAGEYALAGLPDFGMYNVEEGTPVSSSHAAHGKMDVLYVLGPGSKHDNVELRWSLRSLERFAKNLGRVVVCGVIPDWLSDEAVKVPHANDKDAKHKNMLSHIEFAIESGALNGEFLCSSDDHFLAAPVDLADYPYWCKRKWIPTVTERAASGKKVNNWHRSMGDTREVMWACGAFPTEYSCHANTHMHTSDLMAVKQMVRRGEQMGFKLGFEPTCLFMAARMARDPVVVTPRRDLKLREFKGSSALFDTLHELGDLDTFSIADSVFDNPEFEKFMNVMYPKKSRYER